MKSAGRSEQAPPAPRGDATREALVHAAIAVFARDGFHAVSTRTLAQAAGVNQALINYHFGGKEGLYLAVFEYIASCIKARVDPLANALEAALAAPASKLTAAQRRERYLPPLLQLTDGMVSLMLSEETSPWAQLILREQQHPTEAFEKLYEGFMGRLLGLLTQLVRRLRNETSLPRVRFITVGILGQVLVWRASRTSVMRYLGWDTVTERDVAQARESVRRGVVALVFATGDER